MTMQDLDKRITTLESVLGRGKFNSSTVQQKDAIFNGRFGLVDRTTLPSTCAQGEMCIVNGVVFVCAVTNTWSTVTRGLGGIVAAGGTGTVPSGWSIGLDGSTHVYTITHNLGTSSYTVVASSTSTQYYAPSYVFSTNSFTVSFRSSSAAVGTTDWTFILTPL